MKLALEELNRIPEGEVFIIPVRLEDVIVVNESLEDLHRVDLFPTYEKGLEKILRGLGVEAKHENARSSPSLFFREFLEFRREKEDLVF